MRKNRKNRNNNTNFKAKRRLNSIVTFVCLVLVFALLGGIAVATFSSLRERNPDNLLTVDENYIRDKKTGYGLEVKVDDNGIIKLKGQSSRNEELIVQTVKLAAGTYTISGIEKPELDKVVLQATWGTGNIAYAGLDSATFTLDAEYEVTVAIVIEGTEDGENTIDWQNKTIKPVLVKGDVAGEFWK